MSVAAGLGAITGESACRLCGGGGSLMVWRSWRHHRATKILKLVFLSQLAAIIVGLMSAGKPGRVRCCSRQHRMLFLFLA